MDSMQHLTELSMIFYHIKNIYRVILRKYNKIVLQKKSFFLMSVLLFTDKLSDSKWKLVN